MFILDEELFCKTTETENRKTSEKNDINAMTEQLLKDTKIICL